MMLNSNIAKKVHRHCCAGPWVMPARLLINLYCCAPDHGPGRWFRLLPGRRLR